MANDWRTYQELERSLSRATELARQADSLTHLDSATRFLLEEGPRSRALAEQSLVDATVAAAGRSLEPLSATRTLADLHAATAAVGYRDPRAELLVMLSPAKELQRFYDAQFRLPDLREMDRLILESLASNALPLAVFGADLASAQLRGVFDSLQTPWLHAQHVAASVSAMADLQAIGAMAGAAPFETQVAEALRLGLGDWRDPLSVTEATLLDAASRTAFYVDLGFDRTLTAFPAAAFHAGLRQAGLEDEAEFDQEDAAEDPGLARARAAFRDLQGFEVLVRRFISESLEFAAGPTWMKQRIPAAIYERWREKHGKARKNGEPGRPLIDYADFTDYLPIIDRNDNWTEVFAAVFGRKEDIRESLQRLFPVRLCTMHARPITQDDELLLASETRRVRKAIAARI